MSLFEILSLKNVNTPDQAILKCSVIKNHATAWHLQSRPIHVLSPALLYHLYIKHF